MARQNLYIPGVVGENGKTSSVYFGNNEVYSVYFENYKVYEKGTPITGKYFITSDGLNLRTSDNSDFIVQS